MPAFWLTLLVLLAVLAIGQAVVGVVQAYEHRRYTLSRLRTVYKAQPTGRAVLFIPCRGHDEGLEQNLRSLFLQDYDDYEIRFVVESATDPVCRVIRKIAAEFPERCTRIVFAGQATDCGQKVHNLICATGDLPNDVTFLAFADSDARPRPEWLRTLVDRLYRPGIGARTGYRWFIPVRTTVPNLITASANASLGMLLGRGNPNILWGGSWAIRRDRFEQLGIRQAWHGKLNDDLVVTGVLRQANLEVDYEPNCAVASPLDLSAAEMIEFGRRQYLQVRYYLPRCWYVGLVLMTFSTLTFWGAVAAAVATGLAAYPTCLAGALYAISIVRGAFRVRLASELFPQFRCRLRSLRLFDLLGHPIAAFTNWCVLLGATIGRCLVWRDIYYELDWCGYVLSVRHKESRAATSGRHLSTAGADELSPSEAPADSAVDRRSGSAV